MTDDFTQYPTTIGEAKAKTDSRASTWSPRDCLIKTLRKIDSGEVKPTTLVVCYVEEDNEGTVQTYYTASGKTTANVLGAIEMAKLLIYKDSGS